MKSPTERVWDPERGEDPVGTDSVRTRGARDESGRPDRLRGTETTLHMVEGSDPAMLTCAEEEGGVGSSEVL